MLEGFLSIRDLHETVGHAAGGRLELDGRIVWKWAMHRDCCCTKRLLLIGSRLTVEPAAVLLGVKFRLEVVVEVLVDHDPVEGLELDLQFSGKFLLQLCPIWLCNTDGRVFIRSWC